MNLCDLTIYKDDPSEEIVRKMELIVVEHKSVIQEMLDLDPETPRYVQLDRKRERLCDEFRELEQIPLGRG